MNDNLRAWVLDVLADWPEGATVGNDVPVVVSVEQMDELIRIAGFRDMREAQATLDAQNEAINRRQAGSSPN